MIGQHPTPSAIVQRMLDLVAVDDALASGGRILDPGCGEGAFIEAVLRRAVWHAQERGHGLAWVLARVHGVELDPKAAAAARQACERVLRNAGFKPSAGQVHRLVEVCDFLDFRRGNWDVVVANPPYVRLEGLSPAQRAQIRSSFRCAVNRFDLYFAFFEQALRLLKDGGRLCFITPQKYMQVWSGSGLRSVLAENQVRRIQLLDEEAFPGLITYPAITLVGKGKPSKNDVLVVEDDRHHTRRVVPAERLDAEPWREAFGPIQGKPELTLADVAERIGVGIATGADAAFVLDDEWASRIPAAHTRYWIGGRQLPKGERDSVLLTERIVWPYDTHGHLLPEKAIPEIIAFLKRPAAKARLSNRTCVKGGRAWYAFHERPRPQELAKPKILVQDIQQDPKFHVDMAGTVPKHSVYYVVPKPGVDIHALADYLNGPAAREWLRQYCQPAAGGRLRLQTWVLRELPIAVLPAIAKRRQSRLV